jgi:hypothetical protein
MGHGLFPLDDISERNSTESHTDPYRYRLEGIVHVSLHVKIIENSISNIEYESQKY